ncbi:MAG TPA: hypothetical protein VFC40_04805 [Syntrophomonas sp.]|nr:hypothetical protein [Syntrophomonas sp.]
MPSSLIFALLLFVGLFILLEAKSLMRRRAYKELLVASLLLTLALLYGVDYALDWQVLPNPNILLTIFKPLSESVDKFFQVTS